MKHILLFFSLAFTLIACNSGSDNAESKTDTTSHTTHTTTDATPAAGENHMKNMHDAMDGSMQQMKSMSMSGDPDHDFAMMMKHHHQGAIDMAKAELAGGTDGKLKQMAQKMIDEQQKENAAFDSFLQSHKPAGNSEYGKKAMGMMTPMSDIKMESGSLDAMFASMMIPHHQDAVKMAQEYLKVGKNAEIKQMAQKVIESQPKEIQELQDWLANHK
ncbi:MAG: DUF305 domain-containing protein [Chitinophagaceae bacterium]|nr:MAG: DUF305 domain-containing protein [Chitinophagaceae bacterium]